MIPVKVPYENSTDGKSDGEKSTETVCLGIKHHSYQAPFLEER
jgi:hypothetical protein